MTNPMNISCLTGSLTTDPTFLKTKDGKEFAIQAILRVSRNYKNREGVREADFIPIRYEGEKRMAFAHMLKKGDYLNLVGSITTKTYEKDGYKMYSVYFLVDNISFSPRKKELNSFSEQQYAEEQEDLPI